MEKIYEKLKEMSEKKFNTLQCVLGIITGVICWVAIRMSGFAQNGLGTFVLVAVFLVLMVGPRMISRKIERPLLKFPIAMVIALAVCIAIFALFAFVITKGDGFETSSGLLEIIFNIAV